MCMAWSPTYGQESTQSQIGLGVTITSVRDLFRLVEGGDIAPTVYAPIRVSARFRLELQIGFIQTSRKEDVPASTESTSKSFNIGVGIFPAIPGEEYGIYYGARLGFVQFASSVTFSGFSREESLSGFFVAPVIGREFFLSDHFSLGGRKPRLDIHP